MTRRRAAFLDRDGTIIDDVNYIARPEDVRLREGAGDAIALLNERGVAVVVVTNQSGLAQARFSLADYHGVRERVDAELAMHNARIDATYVCPHHPDFTGPCDCRKPGRLLFDQAIADLELDASTSMFAGDRIRDVLPVRTFGGSAYLVRAASTPPDELEQAAAVPAEVVDSLLDAAQRYLGLVEPDIFPASARRPYHQP